MIYAWKKILAFVWCNGNGEATKNPSKYWEQQEKMHDVFLEFNSDVNETDGYFLDNYHVMTSFLCLGEHFYISHMYIQCLKDISRLVAIP